MTKKLKKPTVREVVSIHCGQAGVQIGHGLWEANTAEQGINPRGTIDLENWKQRSASEMEVFFSPAPSGQYVPRSLFLDLEPSVIDEIRSGYYRNLFNPDFLVSGKEDAANNFARGYYCFGRSYIYQAIDVCRSLAERCDNLQGFISYSGFGGGTGSGLLSLLAEQLSIEYAGKTMMQVSINPGEHLSSTIVEPYNALLATHLSVDPVDINMLADNESLYKMCQNKLNINRPTYTNVNRLLCPIISGITAPLMYRGYLTGSLADINVNLVPYPKIHFPMMSYAPLASAEVQQHDLCDTAEITRSAFEEDHHALSCNLNEGRFMSCVLLYRGDTNTISVQKAIQSIKSSKKFNWVDWCPTGFKVSHVYKPPVAVATPGLQSSRSLLLLANHSSIGKPIENIMNNYAVLYRKRAYVHWYLLEGMELTEFEDALIDTKVLVEDYKEVAGIIEKNELREHYSPATQRTNDEINKTCLKYYDRKMQYSDKLEKKHDLPTVHPEPRRSSMSKLKEINIEEHVAEVEKKNEAEDKITTSANNAQKLLKTGQSRVNSNFLKRIFNNFKKNDISTDES